MYEDKVFKSLKSLENNKSPGNDGLFKEFYECFWDEVKKPFLASIHKVFRNEELSTSQKQAGMMVNIDMKIISKVLSTRIKMY